MSTCSPCLGRGTRDPPVQKELLAPRPPFMGKLDTERRGNLSPGGGTGGWNFGPPGKGCLNPALGTGWDLGRRRGGGAQRLPLSTARSHGAPLRTASHAGHTLSALLTKAVTILSFPLEIEVIAQIRLLQSACNNYSIAPEDHFRAWFRTMEPLSETER